MNPQVAFEDQSPVWWWFWLFHGGAAVWWWFQSGLGHRSHGAAHGGRRGGFLDGENPGAMDC